MAGHYTIVTVMLYGCSLLCVILCQCRCCCQTFSPQTTSLKLLVHHHDQTATATAITCNSLLYWHMFATRPKEVHLYSGTLLSLQACASFCAIHRESNTSSGCYAALPTCCLLYWHMFATRPKEAHLYSGTLLSLQVCASFCAIHKQSNTSSGCYAAPPFLIEGM